MSEPGTVLSSIKDGRTRCREGKNGLEMDSLVIGCFIQFHSGNELSITLL